MIDLHFFCKFLNHLSLKHHISWFLRYISYSLPQISIPKTGVESVVSSLLSSSHASVKPIGLGARDSLRLEAGLCLYGSDIDQTTSPIEASLIWLVSKLKTLNVLINILVTLIMASNSWRSSFEYQLVVSPV